MSEAAQLEIAHESHHCTHAPCFETSMHIVDSTNVERLYPGKVYSPLLHEWISAPWIKGGGERGFNGFRDCR